MDKTKKGIRKPEYPYAYLLVMLSSYSASSVVSS